MALLTLSDIQAYRAISGNINASERLLPYVDEAQQVDLEPFLGEAFYYDLISHTTQQKYVDLMNGKVYTYGNNSVKFAGLKPLLAYWSYARFIEGQQLNATSFGFVTKKTEYSEPVTQKTIDKVAANARQVAAKYQSGAIMYLDSNTNLYPLWRLNSNLSTSPHQSTIISDIGRTHDCKHDPRWNTKTCKCNFIIPE